MEVSVSPKHGGTFDKDADTVMVAFGTSSIAAEAEPDPVDCYAAEESFIAASANQHEETMFDDDITSALLNGISNNLPHAMNSFTQFSTTPRDGIEHSITAEDGSMLNQSASSQANNLQQIFNSFHSNRLFTTRLASQSS